MAWDEGFAASYDQWSASMTDDVPFYFDRTLLGEASREYVFVTRRP